MKISIVIPFYNTQLDTFKKCIKSVKLLNPYEIILVDDCSSNEDLVAYAKNIDCVYVKTDIQSGSDGIPFNIGVNISTGDYVCKVDSDDELLELPDVVEGDFHLAVINRVKPPYGITIKELILQPRAIINGIVIKKEICKLYPMVQGQDVYNDILFMLRLLYNKHTFTVNKTISYKYNISNGSIQTSKTWLQHRLRHIETVARFCQLENIDFGLVTIYLDYAIANLKYGKDSVLSFP
jgi:glycosyltransferase involved in cell wall biosynthesis